MPKSRYRLISSEAMDHRYLCIHMLLVARPRDHVSIRSYRFSPNCAAYLSATLPSSSFHFIFFPTPHQSLTLGQVSTLAGRTYRGIIQLKFDLHQQLQSVTKHAPSGIKQDHWWTDLNRMTTHSEAKCSSSRPLYQRPHLCHTAILNRGLYHPHFTVQQTTSATPSFRNSSEDDCTE
jgi:hypothetical protein